MFADKQHLLQWTFVSDLDYSGCLNLQRKLQQRVISSDCGAGGYLLLVEHKPVITIGRYGSPENILISPENMNKRGIEFYKIDRGGDVTIHGPGQLVVYPIISLKHNNMGVKNYVEMLENVVINVLYNFGITAKKLRGYPGVWVNNKKIASIGIYIRRSVTMHGFSLNINNDISFFSCIVPCGLKDINITSMKEVLRREIQLRHVIKLVVKEFSNGFQSEMVYSDEIIYE